MALFEARHLHKRFGSQVVLEDISLTVERGELRGIIGPNGAGKTTCFNVLTGRYRPDRGQVTFDGRDITGLSPRRVAQRGISRSFQVMNLFDEYAAIDNVVIALPAVRARGWSMWRDLARQHSAYDEAATILQRVGLSGKEHVPSRSLSYGERRALEIGVALAAKPKLLFLDEPTAGLGAEGTVRLTELVASSQARAHDRDHRARHALLVRAGRSCIGDPLGTGDRRRHTGRTARQPVGAALQPREPRGMSRRAAPKANAAARSAEAPR